MKHFFNANIVDVSETIYTVIISAVFISSNIGQFQGLATRFENMSPPYGMEININKKKDTREFT